MKRFIVLGSAIIFALISAAVLVSIYKKPSETDYRLARGRSEFFTENYLAALQTLRDLPASQKRGAEAHSYLGAAYLKLHLYNAAIKEFEEAIKERPRQSDPWVGLASSNIELGNPQKAVDQAKRATELEKRSVEAWIALARAQWQQQNQDEAEKAAQKARELDPDNDAVSDVLLHIYFDGNQPDKFQAELDRNSKPSKTSQDLAVRFALRQGQFARAYDLKTRYEREALNRSIVESELALKREPSKTESIPSLVKNLVQLGRYDEAITAAKNHVGPVSLQLELGKAYWATGGKEEAIRAYERASAELIHRLSAEVALAAITGDIKHWQAAYRAERVELDYFVLARLEDVLAKGKPLDRAFVYRYAGLYDASFYNNTAKEALKVLQDDPRNFDGLMTIATAYQRLGKLQDATRYVQTARELYPNRSEPASRLASIGLQGQKENPQVILQLMETAVKLEPNNAGYLYNLGWAYDQLGETTKATELYQRAIKQSPLSFEAMNNLALIYSSGGQPERALPLLEQAMRTDPENEAVYENLANYYVRRRDWKLALQNYDRALQINPGSSVAAVEKGRIHLEQGEMENAIDNLSRALEVNPHSFDAYMLLSSSYEKMGHIKEAIAATEEAQRVNSSAPEIKATLDRLNSRQKK